MTADHLIEPHGGALVDLVVDDARASELKKASQDWPSWDLTERQLCDFELLANGGFSPLRGFLTEEAHDSVLSEMRLPDGTLWPLPITLDVTEDFAAGISMGDSVALRDPEGTMLGVLTVESIWTPDKEREAIEAFGTTDAAHPAVAYLNDVAGPVYVGGPIEALQLPNQYDFVDLRKTPAQVRDDFARHGWRSVVAFQTRNPMHRAHVEITRRAAEEVGANLLIHPVVGMTKPGDVDHFTRVRVYQHVLQRYPKGTADLALLPLAMRMAGPREAVLHAIIRKNHGVTHFIVGRDHAGPGQDSQGNDIYGPYDAQELLAKHVAELGIEMVPFKMMVYLPSKDAYEPVDEIPEGTETASISGTELRERLAFGREIPEWFSYPEVVEELRRTHPPRSRRGFVVFMTGLSGSGKSTVANVLRTKLLEAGGRTVTLLDGDLVRKNLSSELGFSKEHRDLNILRIGYVASEIAKHGGIAICAPIAPYDEVRKQNRRTIEENGGGHILVHISTPIETCEARDRKGLYAKARAGIITGFTGIDDPYEEPEDADIAIDTTDITPEEAANQILLHLEKEGWYGAS
ncbi:MAG: bifunctional sulfate adenylyltransferase/adenylylsulfate kinase [Nitriliruptorales bacterium]|nr:bifunctional sulfate adenylyltransferase/adenylylsulfate kinase [Nitriliruptorales bacterium]